MSAYLMGLDLSLRGPGVVVLPGNWIDRGASWDLVESWRFGSELPSDATERERALRDDTIARKIAEKADAYDVRHVFIEGYAFSKNSSSVTKLAELGGVVRRALVVGLNCDVERVTASAARKHLFGPISRGTDIKKLVASSLARMGADFPTGDEADAFVIANYGLALMGRSSLMSLGVPS